MHPSMFECVCVNENPEELKRKRVVEKEKTSKFFHQYWFIQAISPTERQQHNAMAENKLDKIETLAFTRSLSLSCPLFRPEET